MKSYRLMQDGVVVAEVSSEDDDAAQREIKHYAAVYAQDGPVEITGPHDEVFDDEDAP